MGRINKEIELHVFFSGLVQGVNFRFFARQFAIDLKVVGFVKNLTDGRVEMLAIGSKEKVDMLLGKILKNPEFFGRIDDVDAKYQIAEKSFKDFRIVY